jgi:hypothetical protein
VFVLPGIGLLAYLVLSEKDRLKPWAKALYGPQANAALNWNDSTASGRFGMISGAIWIFAIALFVTLGFAGSWKWSWVTFLFAVGFQTMLPAFFMGRAENDSDGGEGRP